MPVYEYRCLSCGQTSEAIVLPGESEPAHCSYCGGALTRKIPSSVGIAFKGSGFFVTDNRRSKDKSSGREQSEDGASASAESCCHHSFEKTSHE